MSDNVKLTIKLDVTVPQALAIKAMFEKWNELSDLKSSRYVEFFVDGGGEFNTHCQVTCDGDLPELTLPIRELALVKSADGTFSYDSDPIYWALFHKETE